MEKVDEKKKIHQGNNVRRRRNDKGYSLEYLGELTKIPFRKLSIIESQEEIDNELLNKIAMALETDINWFKSYDPDSVPFYGFSIGTNNNSDTATQSVTQNRDVNNTTINNPIDEIIAVTDKALALQKEAFEREKELMIQLHEMDKEIALLKQEKQLTSK